VVKLVIAVVYSINAGRGEWAEYPLLGAPARRVLNIEPGAPRRERNSLFSDVGSGHNPGCM
jgi:hypothetical protein